MLPDEHAQCGSCDIAHKYNIAQKGNEDALASSLAAGKSFFR